MVGLCGSEHPGVGHWLRGLFGACRPVAGTRPSPPVIAIVFVFPSELEIFVRLAPIASLCVYDHPHGDKGERVLCQRCKAGVSETAPSDAGVRGAGPASRRDRRRRSDGLGALAAGSRERRRGEVCLDESTEVDHSLARHQHEARTSQALVTAPDVGIIRTLLSEVALVPVMGPDYG